MTNEYCKEDKPALVPYSRERIIHNPKQITSPEQLVFGRLYDCICTVPGVNSNSTRRFIEIKDGLRAILESTDGEKYQSEVSLADKAVIPYKDGRWNKYNYLIPHEEVISPNSSSQKN